MAAKAGVWIDHRQAIVVRLTDAGQEITKFKSEEPAGAAAGAVRPKNKFTPNDFVAEDRRERRLASDFKKMYDAVLACVRGVDALLIVGPGEAKGELSKHIKAKKLRGLAVAVETADKMTERQLAAKVAKHFAQAPASKTAAVKRTATAKPGKPTKKAVKK